MSVIRFDPVRRPALALGESRCPVPGGVVGRLRARLREWRRRGRDRAELAALDARMLADIGLSRAESEFVVNKPFWRE